MSVRTRSLLLPVALAGVGIVARLAKEGRSARPDALGDTHYYVAWGEQAHRYGLLNLYNVSQEESRKQWGRHALNYGPVFAYYVYIQNRLRRVLWGEARYYHPGMLVALLVPQAICYVLTGLAVRKAVEPVLGERKAMMGAWLYWLSPGMLATAAYHGQTDAFICLTMVLCLNWGIRQQWARTGALWMLAALVKPQPVLIAPVLCCLIVRQARWKNALLVTFPALAVLAVVAGPFVLAHGDWPARLAWWSRTYRESFSLWNLTTNKAYNLWWLDATLLDGQRGEWPAMDPASTIGGIPRSWIGLGASLLVMAVATAGLLRRTKPDLVRTTAVAALIGTGAFLLLTRMWDRYLGYGLAMMVPWALADPFLLVAYAAISLAWFVNLLYPWHVGAVSAGWFLPPVWVTGALCAAVFLSGFLTMSVRFGRLLRTDRVRHVDGKHTADAQG